MDTRNEIVKLWQDSVFGVSAGRQWIKIDEAVRIKLDLPNGIGICGGILCTQASARGANAFIDRLNNRTNELAKREHKTNYPPEIFF